MKASWRRGNFLKAPKFQKYWMDNEGRSYMVMDKTDENNTRWALLDSAEWGDNDQLAYCRAGKDEYGDPNELPEEGDVIRAEREGAAFHFVIIQVFRSVGRTKTVPLIIQPA